MQGFNMGRYVPPEQEGVLSFNQASGKGHALGDRARKLKSEGILIVRFEMPYAVWCTTCPKPTIIGQGVRFNAEKKKVGNYHSTPIYSFGIKHTVCGGRIEIRTDPQNTAYVVVSGGKARDHGTDKVRQGEDGLEILSTEERERRREDAFAVLEGRIDDKKTEKESKKRIEQLLDDRDKHWQDPYARNSALRRSFRPQRKVRERNVQKAEAIKDRLGLGVDLLPEAAEDEQRAAVVEYGLVDDGAVKAVSKPLFAASKDKHKHGSGAILKSGTTRKQIDKKAALGNELRNRTRANLDPFGLGLGSSGPLSGPSTRAGVVVSKRKGASAIQSSRPAAKTGGPVLVDYDSD